MADTRRRRRLTVAARQLHPAAAATAFLVGVAVGGWVYVAYTLIRSAGG